MKLSFNSPYLSIQSLPTTDLPPFTLITGVNGAGKTHLLKAIKAGHVEADIAPDPEGDIRFFDWTTLVPNDTGEFHAAAVYNERDQIIEWGTQTPPARSEALMLWASKHSLLGKIANNPSSYFRLTQPDISRLINDQDLADQAWNELQSITQEALNQMKKHARNNPPIQAKLQQLEQRYGSNLLTLTVREFENEPSGWGQVDVFQQSFAQLFMSYFEFRRLNLLHRLDKAEGRQPI